MNGRTASETPKERNISPSVEQVKAAPQSQRRLQVHSHVSHPNQHPPSSSQYDTVFAQHLLPAAAFLHRSRHARPQLRSQPPACHVMRRPAGQARAVRVDRSVSAGLGVVGASMLGRLDSIEFRVGGVSVGGSVGIAERSVVSARVTMKQRKGLRCILT